MGKKDPEGGGRSLETQRTPGRCERFRPQKQLSPTGSGKEIWLATDLLSENRQVVLKKLLLSPEIAGSPRQLLTLLDSYLSLSHPGLAKSLDIFSDGTPHTYWTVSEFIPGNPFLPAARNLSQGLLLDLIAQFCSVLHYLHARGFAHLDLHPGNVLVCPPADGSEKWNLKIIDLPLFPLRFLNEYRGSVTFHPRYSAPEVLTASPCDCNADLYSVGALFYETLIGDPPSTAPGAAEYFSQRDDNHLEHKAPIFSSLIRRLLDSQPEKRPPSAYYLLEDINARLTEYKLTLGEPTSPAQAVTSIPLILTPSLLSALDTLDEWTSDRSPAGSYELSTTGLPGSGHHRAIQTFILYLKIKGWHDCIKRESARSEILCTNNTPKPDAVVSPSPSHNESGAEVPIYCAYQAPTGMCQAHSPDHAKTIIMSWQYTGFADKRNGHASQRIRTINLAPLNEDACRLFIDRALLNNSLSKGCAHSIAERSLGLPHLLMDLLLAQVSTGIIVKRGAVWECPVGDDISVLVPEPAHHYMRHAFTGISFIQLQILNLLSLTPFPLDSKHVAEILTLSKEGLRNPVKRLASLGIVHNSGREAIP